MNGKELLSRAIVTGGVLLGGGSAVDFAVNNTAFMDQMNREIEISNAVDKKYGIEMECRPGIADPGATVCYDIVPSAKTTDEKNAVLTAAREETRVLQEAVQNPEAETRAAVELAGLLAGATLVAVGDARKSK